MAGSSVAVSPMAAKLGERSAPEPLGDGFDRFRTIDVFEDGLAEVCGHLHALHARLVAMVAEALERGWWAQDGVKSPEHWLCWQAGLAPTQAKRVVAAARRRSELPATFAAFDAGELSLDQVGPIVDRAPAWADAQACELAKRCTVTQIRATVGRYPFDENGDEEDRDDEAGGLDAPEASDAPTASGASVDEPPGESGDPPSTAAGADEYWSLTQDLDGSWRVSGRLAADVGLVVDAATREVADALFRESGRAPTGGEVIEEMARRSLAAVTDHGRRDRYRVHLLLDERRELLDPLGHTLPRWVRDLITCDAKMAITWTRHGVPIAQGSTADTIPAATRRHVLARDHGCRVPGCGAKKRLDVHHIVHRADGGTNDADNLVALCPWHHRLHHRGQLGITGDPERADRLVFTDGSGRRLGTNRFVRPPTAGPPPPSGSYRHPIGERLDRRDVSFWPPSGIERQAPSEPVP